MIKLIKKKYLNPYANITMHQDAIFEWELQKKSLLVGFPLISLSIFGFAYLMLVVNKDIPIYSIVFSYLFYFCLIFSFLYIIYFMKNYYSIMYRYKERLKVIIPSIFMASLIFPVTSNVLFFSILDTKSDIDFIYMVSLTYIIAMILSAIYFSSYWKKVYESGEYKKYNNLLKAHNYIYDNEKFFLNKEKNKSGRKKIFKILTYPLTGLMISLPAFVAAFSTSGSVNVGEIYLIALITIISIPYLIKILFGLIQIYKCIDEIEKTDKKMVFIGRW